jgi:tyrosyl-tRNA synthetase
LVFPLITTASGTKFGKSEAGNIWLDPAKTSPYQFYQFWINTDDRDVERYLKLFTFAPLEEISELMRAHLGDPGKRLAQQWLARNVTERVHGRAARDQAITATTTLFGPGVVTGHLLELLKDMPSRRVSRANLPVELPIVDLLLASGLATSKADARRGIQGRGFYLNGEPIEKPDLQVSESELQGSPEERYVILRKGKKNYVRLVLEP